MNKYQKIPEAIIDLHGYTTWRAKMELDKLLNEHKYSFIRIITGKCSYREHGPILGPFVKKYLEKKNLKFNQAKIQNGGEGALEVYITDRKKK
ncbi:MAG: Smr/MutS family protein [Candidatus Parcubacteria bacterium]|nr:Smr/MutS family protein [Candidatus Parcubacteria bacterium]